MTVTQNKLHDDWAPQCLTDSPWKNKTTDHTPREPRSTTADQQTSRVNARITRRLPAYPTCFTAASSQSPSSDLLPKQVRYFHNQENCRDTLGRNQLCLVEANRIPPVQGFHSRPPVFTPAQGLVRAVHSCIQFCVAVT